MLPNKVVLNMNFENQLKECDELYEKQDYEALIEKCDEILGQFPYNPNAICYKGVSLHKLGETDEALNILEKGVETNPDDCPLRNNLALIYCELEEYEKVPKALQGKL